MTARGALGVLLRSSATGLLAALLVAGAPARARSGAQTQDQTPAPAPAQAPAPPPEPEPAPVLSPQDATTVEGPAIPPHETPVETVEPPDVVVAGEGEPPALSGPVAGQGPIVARVELRSDASLETGDKLRQLLAVEPGERLTDRAVRRTVRNLQATGAANEVELYTRPAEPGERIAPPAAPAAADQVVVVVAVWAAVQVDGVSIAGETGKLDRRDLENELLVAAGQPLIESRLLRSVYRLQDFFEARGYFAAKVHLAVATNEETKRAKVTFQVDAGPRSDIGQVRFDGDLGPFSPATLVAQLKAHPGDPFRRETVDDDAERLQTWLINQKYRKAQVGEVEVTHELEGHRVDLTYPVSLGPLVTAAIVGVPRKDLEKNDLLPFLGDDGYDEALVLQAVDRVKRYYQEKGHWKVDVSWDETTGDGKLEITFRVEPGPVYTLQEVHFEGNQEVSDDKLSELMETTPRRLLTLGSGRLVDSVLQDDLENIRSYYALQGYANYKVGPPDVETEGGDLTLTVPIAEGTRRQVVDLSFSGVDALSEDDLRHGLPLQAGGPFHPLLLEDSLRQIRGRYEEKGFLSTQVSSTETWNGDHTLVDVEIEVIEGPQTRVDRVIVRGNVQTDDDVIEHAVDLDPGEPVSPTRLLEAERDLYGLGIFSRVQVELGPSDLSEQERDVVIRVQEGRTRRVSYGLGYDTDTGLAGLVGYRQGNLFGRAFTLQTDLRYGQRERLARVALDQPDLTRWHIPLVYNVAFQQEELPSYDVDRIVTQAEAVKQEDVWRYGLAFDYRIINSTLTVAASQQITDPTQIIERRDQDIHISSVIPNVLVDRRNDPIDPTRGWSASARFQWAFPIPGLTDANFLKTFLQHTRYQPLGFGHLAGSIRFGAIAPLEDATKDNTTAVPGVPQPPEPPNLKIPIDERFFAGGDFSHRAYGKDELGIPGTTLFADGRGRGGNGLLLANLDYRFPVWGPVGGVLWVDAGNVWPDWRDVDPRDVKTGVGVAVRYVSPIGPVRAGFGYQLDPDPGATTRFHFYLAVGNPF